LLGLCLQVDASALLLDHGGARVWQAPVFPLVARNRAIRALLKRDLGERVENKIEGGGYPIPGILQSVRNRLILKELEKTVAFKCGSGVRNRLISKELREIFALVSR
jgi:hypothetical protein